MTDDATKPEEAPKPRTPAGALARFDGQEALLAAARRMREAGYTRWDAHSPYPVHGIERAMGIRPTILPWLVLVGGFAGMGAALFLQWWTNATSFNIPLPGSLRGYQLLISGKPYFSLPANIPITFELIVLFSAITAFLGVLMLNRLPEFCHPVFASEQFRRVTTDGFFVSVDAGDPKFDQAATQELLASLGAESVELCFLPEKGREFPRMFGWYTAVIVLVALLPVLLIARARTSRSGTPRLDIIQDMDFQPKYKTQTASSLFADGRVMRPPVAGTIAFDRPVDDPLRQTKVDGNWVTAVPIDVTMAAMRRGQERFNIYCAACHGLTGEGGKAGIVSVRALAREDSTWTPPASLHDDRIVKMTDGELFAVMTDGVRTMPSYAAQIPPEDRWAIVLYVRALQRSENAGPADVPPDKRRVQP